MKRAKLKTRKSQLQVAESQRRKATALAIKTGKISPTTPLMFSEELVKSAKFDVESVSLKS